MPHAKVRVLKISNRSIRAKRSILANTEVPPGLDCVYHDRTYSLCHGDFWMMKIVAKGRSKLSTVTVMSRMPSSL